MSNRRRSERSHVSLDVEFIVNGRKERFRTANVSLHGLAVYSDAILPLKQFVEMEIILPLAFGNGRESVLVTAQVIRAIKELKDQTGLSHLGLGFNFHSFSDEGRAVWRRFLGTTNQSLESESRSDLPQRIIKDNDKIAFVVRQKDADRLWLFYEKELSRGRSRVESPQVLTDFTTVELVVVHPKTDAEWIFSGTVLSQIFDDNQRINVIEIGLNDLSAKDRKKFQKFINTGNSNRPSNKKFTPAADEETPTPLQKPAQKRPAFAAFFDEFASSKKD